MTRPLVVLLSVLVSLILIAAPASAKSTPDKTLAQLKPMETPLPEDPPDPSYNTMYRAAAAGTTLLGWWQFDTLTGQPDEQGWTKHDITAPADTNWHVDGLAGGGPDCCPITPVNGSQSMWCGACPSTGPPYCGYSTLPGYGNTWEQHLLSQTLACTTLTVGYTIEWDSEPAYDYTYVQYWDDALQDWVDLPVNSGQGSYDGSGGPLVESFPIAPPNATTQIRFRFSSDGAWSDEDGLWPTNEGAAKVDDISLICPDIGTGFNHFEDWEGEQCGQTGSDDGMWGASSISGYSIYAALHSGASTLQTDDCTRLLSSLWGFFDDPARTNYACGGWPLQGAVPYGPDENGLYLNNQIWSPPVPYTGTGDEVLFSFYVYRDLPLDNLIFYQWHVRSVVSGCPTNWADYSFVYYGYRDWLNSTINVGSLIDAGAEQLQLALGAIDMCGVWCGYYGTGSCHSHAPLFDQVRLVRVDSQGPQWQIRHIDLFQDNFSEDGTITGPARADMAQDILPNSNGGILPGDSITVGVFDPNGLTVDATYGGAAVYCFVRVGTNGPPPSPAKSGLVIQSPDVRPPTAPNPGAIRYPWVGDVLCGGNTWSQFRMDSTYTSGGGWVSDRYCFDLEDVANGRHVNEDQIANVGVFTPGDTIWYFFGAENSLGQWTYWHRAIKGQGLNRSTSVLAEACTDPCEFSILPDAGRVAGEEGDILYVDDADDRGGPAQLYFDSAFDWLQIRNRVDRFDVMGPSSVVGNSLASRVKNTFTQIIGDPVEIYQKIIWCSSNLSTGLIGDGGSENGGSGSEKSDDYALLYTFLTNHPENPGVYVSGDDMASEWMQLSGAAALNVKATYMNFNLVNYDHTLAGESVSPTISQSVGSPIGPSSMIAYGGCPLINDFDVIAPTGASFMAMEYGTAGNGAVLAQATPTPQATTARYVLEGFAYNYIRDDATIPPQVALDRAVHLHDILVWFENIIPDPVGVDPVAFENRLDNAYPNPFNPVTRIEYSIRERGHVTLRVYNAAGQLVRTLVDGIQSPRETGFAKTWDGINDQGQAVSSGVYFYKLTSKGFSQTKKMVLLK
ncbi:MAG: T9SS type A sorting domain-containing protein [Candidatus Latescibacterota bacterium]|nr:MAG: T9SS type A sorting domain-containing protein [Candidatus Latescibacterota bacterium]